MISGVVPFEEIVQSVKDETGIENIRPLYEKIRRLIFRAEREIGYGGTVEIMKKTYPVPSNIDSSINKYFKFPEDLIEFEGIGQNCCKVPSCKYTAAAEGVRFKEHQTKPIVVLYWGIKTDDNGYPIVTRNHEEAVVAFIVWKLYSQRIFLGIGNMNAKKDYEQSFISLLLEARGDDAFPTIEQWEDLGKLSYVDRRLLIDEPVHTFDYCAEVIDENENPPVENVIVKYWQTESGQEMNDIIPLIDDVYLLDKQELPLESFENGYSISYVDIARIAFAMLNTDNVGYSFKNSVGSSIDNAFDSYYFSDLRIKIYVSKNIIVPSRIEFKITKS